MSISGGLSAKHQGECLCFCLRGSIVRAHVHCKEGFIGVNVATNKLELIILTHGRLNVTQFVDVVYLCCVFACAGQDKRFNFMLSVLLLQVLTLTPATSARKEIPLRLRTLLDSTAPSPALTTAQADNDVGARTGPHTLVVLL
jgi:hypothetical protein